MAAKWGCCVMLMICLGILAGCRTSRPNLKPDTTKEQFVSPPMDARYETSTYPKQAYDTPSDPGKRLFEDKNGMVMPARGGAGMPGMGGAGGMGR